MSCVDVLDRCAVSCHISLHSVCTACDCVDVVCACRRRYMVHGVVRSHDGRKVVILDELLVRVEVELPHVPAVHVRAAYMAVELAVVREVMLCAWHGLHVVRVVAHESAYICSGHHCRKERILSVRLSGSSPPWVAYRLYYRRPECEALCAGLEDRSCFVCNRIRFFFKKFRIP